MPKDRTCTVDGCDRKQHGLGWCTYHYGVLRDVPPCSVPGCSKRSKAGGLCSMHYQRKRKTGSEFTDPYPIRYCEIDGCEEKHFALGMCSHHYTIDKNHGDPLAPPSKMFGPLEDRIFARLEFGENRYEGTRCLEWQLTPALVGYAVIGWEGKNIYVHRWMYDRWVGPIPDGYTIDHLCMNKICVNTLHLEAVTTQENTRRYWASEAGRKRASRGRRERV